MTVYTEGTPCEHAQERYGKNAPVERVDAWIIDHQSVHGVYHGCTRVDVMRCSACWVMWREVEEEQWLSSAEIQEIEEEVTQ